MAKRKNTLRFNMFDFDLFKRSTNYLYSEIRKAEGLSDRARAVFSAYDKIGRIHSGFRFKSPSSLKREQKELSAGDIKTQAERWVYTAILKYDHFEYHMVEDLARLIGAKEFLPVAKEAFDTWFERSANFEGNEV